MLEKIKQPENSLSIQEIEQTEKTLKVSLPLQYKNFLLKHNGGRPEPDKFDIDWTKDQIHSEVRQECSEDWRSSMFGCFLSIHEGESSHLLEYNQVSFENRIPKETIAIAYDAGGNLILLGISGQQTGKVLFWAKDYENWESDDEIENVSWYDNIGFLADSFDEFLNEKLYSS
jgi:hypothetical protein